MKINSLEVLFHEELKDVYDAEKRLTKALPKMMKAAHSEELKAAFKSHLGETTTQVGRLETIFGLLSVEPSAKTCLAIKGLLEEGEEAMKAKGETPFTDILLIGAARRVEHYEMSAYLTLRDIAMHLGLPDVEDFISATLDEESAADDTLSAIARKLMQTDGSVVATSRKRPSAQAQNDKRKPAFA